MAKEMFFIGMKITIPVTTSAKVAEGDQQMIFTESQTKEKAFDREKMTDNQTGLSMSGVSASYYFPVKKEPSLEDGHYKASYEISFEVNGIYRFPHRVFTKFGLGVVAQGATTSDKVKDEIRYVQSDVSYVQLYVPIWVGYQFPLWKRTHLDVHTGVRMSCLVGGYEKSRSSSHDKWIKTKAKDMKALKCFHAAWTVGADIKFGGVAIGCEYLHTLEHKPLKALDLGAIAVTLSFTIDWRWIYAFSYT